MDAPDVIVVGAGVIGCSVAYALARRGVRARVIERDAVGAHASSAAAGMLAPIAEARRHPALLEVGLGALEAFPAWVEELHEASGIDPQLVVRGLVRVQRAGADDAGVPVGSWGIETWSAAELQREIPGLANDLAGATFSPREGVVDPARLTRACAAAAERLGARFELGVPVLGLLHERGRVVGVRTPYGARRAEHVVWCAGAWGGPPELPFALPVEPVKGQMLALESSALRGGPLIWDASVYLVPRGDGLLRVGATSERAGFDVRATARGMLELLSGAVRLAPALAQARFESTWAGLRPGTPDGRPLVGPLQECPGLCLALGHGRHGILLSGITGEWVADALLEPTALRRERALFAPERFAGPRRGVGGAERRAGTRQVPAVS